MNEDKKDLFRNLGMISSMGISVVVAIAIMTAPLHAMRHAGTTVYLHPLWRLFRVLEALVSFGFLVFALWWMTHHVPDVRQFFEHLQRMWNAA